LDEAHLDRGARHVGVSKAIVGKLINQQADVAAALCCFGGGGGVFLITQVEQS
jgi:uncharacterized protein (UPF0261 family)